MPGTISLWILRGLFWQRANNRPWLGIWRDRERFYFFPIICNPIRELMQLPPEFFRRNITKGLSIFHSKPNTSIPFERGTRRQC